MVASKFTQRATERILQATAIGCAQETAAALAGIDQATLSRWLTRGKKELERAGDEDEVSAYASFYRDYAFAQAAPRERALGIVYREMDNRPDLAWRYVERKEPGYAPPQPAAFEKPAGPVIIQLSLSDGSPVGAFAPTIDVTGSTREQDERTRATDADAADTDTPPTVLSLAEGGSE